MTQKIFQPGSAEARKHGCTCGTPEAGHSKLSPGSQAAINEGCTCEVAADNKVVVSITCPLHWRYIETQRHIEIKGMLTGCGGLKDVFASRFNNLEKYIFILSILWTLMFAALIFLM